MRLTAMAAMSAAVALLGCAAHPGPIRAITEDGKTVLLYPSGTWEYAGTPRAPGASARAYTKPANAAKGVRGKRVPYSFWFDESKWKVIEQPANDVAEYEFQHTTGEGFAAIIPERLPVPLDDLKEIALNNARRVSRDIKITGDERRTVNDADVAYLRMEGTAQGVPMVFQGYYYSGKQGTVQVFTWTHGGLLEEHRADFEEFLNGFVAN